MNNSYKIYQLLHFFVSRFSYQVLLTQSKDDPDTIWLINTKECIYPLIRVTTKTLEQVIFEKESLKNSIVLFQKQFSLHSDKFLDVHISLENISEEEFFDSVCIEENHYSGIELTPIFPGVTAVIHKVENPVVEIQSIIFSLNKSIAERRLQKKKWNIQNFSITLSVILTSFTIYLLMLFLNTKVTNSTSLILVGGNYSMFTIGAKEYWRLFTSSFVHFSWLHLSLNCLSFYQLGNLYEKELGKIKFTIILLVSALISSLCSLIFHNNVLSGGLSGVIYSLLAFYVCEVIKNQGFTFTIYRLLALPLLINFLPGIDVFGHLGGGAIGILFYFLYRHPMRKSSVIISIFIILISGFLKINSRSIIYPIYYNTDNEVLSFYRQIGWHSYSDKINQQLLDIYRMTYDYLEGK